PLFRARSSAGEDLQFISEGSGDECCPRFLSGVADHSATEMGMSRYVHLLIDETGGAHSPDFARAPEATWRVTAHWRSAGVLVSSGTPPCTSVGEGIIQMQAWLPREESACDGSAHHFRRSGSRSVVGLVRCRTPKTTVRLARRGAE